MDVSHALMTVIWSRRNTGLSAGRGLVLVSEKDGYPFFFTSLSLQLTPHGAPATHTHTHTLALCHFRCAAVDNKFS